jgi:cell filamentation protein
LPNNPEWDEYLQPNGTLKNLLGITDSSELERVEYKLSTRRSTWLAVHHFVLPNRTAIVGNDFSEIMQAHKYLFEGVYAWAGQFRKVDMAKGNTHFLEARFLYEAVNDIQRRLDEFKSVPMGNKFLVAQRLGDIISALNYMHPFREGNGRTQRLMLEAMARAKGFELQLQAGTDGYREYFDASITDDAQQMAAVIARHIVDITNKD